MQQKCVQELVQMRSRLCLLSLMLSLTLPSVLVHGPWYANHAKPRPIVAAFEDIHIGMTDTALLELLAPYKESFTEHYQWRSWSEGETRVAVTLGIFTHRV